THGHRPLSEPGHRCLGMAARRRSDGRPRRRGVGGPETRSRRAFRTAATAPRPDACHVSLTLQRAVPVSYEQLIDELTGGSAERRTFEPRTFEPRTFEPRTSNREPGT